MKPLANKVVLVTGGGRGIGAAAALQLAQAKARVIITSRTEAEMKNVIQHVTTRVPGAQIAHFVADISNEKQVASLFDFAKKTYGPVEILVNNAAILEMGSFLEQSQEIWDRMWEVNVRGAALCARAAFEQMKANGGGSIVNVGSLSGVPHVEKFPNMSAYIVTKYAIAGLTEALAVEGKPYKIRVNCVAPGATETQMLHKAAPDYHTSTLPDDVAKVIVFLADASQSGTMNGTTVPLMRDEI